MKKLIQILYILFFISGACQLRAAEISPKQAGVVAKNFYYERVNQYRDIAWNEIRPSLLITEKTGSTPYYYIFTVNTGGFVIVSANDHVIPVIGYSLTDKLESGNIPDNFKGWMDHYKNEIADASAKNLKAPESTREDWNRLLIDSPSGLKKLKDVQSVSPMMTALWNQDKFYNDSCPADAAAPSGYNGHVPSGCVATAMAMLMYYYRWPNTGTGSYSYVHPTYGQISANFANATYHWDQMTNSVTAANPTVAQLIYHEGVSVDMDYGPTGSGMWNHKAAYSMRTYFKYLPQTQYLFKDSTSLNWDSAILVHLDRRQILYYAGWAGVGSTDGHAFICDGYQTTSYFHFNWGWAGQYNGYFYLNALNPGGNNFNYAQELILNMYPDTLHYTYPEYCNGQTITHNQAGTIEDGSGPVKNYLPNSSCSWLIDPQVNPQDSVKSINIIFNTFDTEQGQDILTVYDGPTTSSPVLGTFSGNSLPSSLTSTGNKVLITFVTNGSIQNNGWLLSYRCNYPTYCSAGVLTAPSGTISDGSGSKFYQNNTNCNWTIQPPFAVSGTMTFTEFSTDTITDFLEVYDLGTSALLGRFSGHHLPPVLTSTSGSFYLVFKTNATVTDAGWSANYSTVTGIDEENANISLQVLPNPAQDQLNLRIGVKENMKVTLNMSDLTGRILLSKELLFQPGMNTEQIDISRFKSGIYLIRLENDTSVLTRKITKL